MYKNLERFWPVVREKLQSCVVGEERYKQNSNHQTALVAPSVGTLHLGHAVNKSPARVQHRSSPLVHESPSFYTVTRYAK